MVALVIDEDLGLVVKTAKRGGMQYAVTVPGIGLTCRARRLVYQPSATLPLDHRIGSKPHPIRWPIDAVAD